ncbi:MAG: AIR synthase-related protein [Candidatus Woesearchaeota archaeon]|nr:AIR synthase-related protein [Candidatus Woesearchaeota archaeon]
MTQKLGEDYENREAKSVEAAKKAIANSKADLFSRRIVGGFFSDLYETIHPEYYSFSTCDSVGSKLMLAHASVQYPELSDLLQKQRIASIAGKFDTIAIDGIAMNVNDAAPWGSAFFDQLTKFTACQAAYEEKEIAGDVELGLIKAMKLADVSNILKVPKINLGKCETASLEETITTVDEMHGFELVFSGFGFISKRDVLEKGVFTENGFEFYIKPKQIIVGFESSGLHSNGYTAARLRLLNGHFEKREKYRKEYTGWFHLDEKVPGYGSKTFLEVLLEPTIIYSRAMARIAKEFPYVIGVNITGNGLANFNRAGKNVEYVIDDPITPQPIFELFEEEVEGQFKKGKITERYDAEKIYRKLNMGMGFACIVNKNDANKAIELAKQEGIKGKIIGHVASGSGDLKTKLILPGKKPVVFEGYM